MLPRTLIAMMAVCGTLWSGSTAAKDSEKSWEGTVAARTLNVRAGPSTGQEIVARLKRGQKLEAFDEEGRWVHVREFDDTGRTGWVSRAFVRLPEDFLAPAFGDIENAFLEWASTRGDLSEISIDADNRLSMVLDPRTSSSRAPFVAREVACAYRARLGLETPVVATVWPPDGPTRGWTAQVTCP